MSFLSIARGCYLHPKEESSLTFAHHKIKKQPCLCLQIQMNRCYCNSGWRSASKDEQKLIWGDMGMKPGLRKAV